MSQCSPDIVEAAKRMHSFNALTQLVTIPWDNIDPQERNHWIGLACAALSKPMLDGAARVQVRIPTDTMEQEFQSHYRRGYQAGVSATRGAAQPSAWPKEEIEPGRWTDVDPEVIAQPWPPLKKALWNVLMAENLNDGHYIKAFHLIEKLWAAACTISSTEDKS